MFHVWSSAKYTFPLPEGHRFPISKYALLRERVIAEGIVPAERVHDPARVSREDLRLVHTDEYIDRIETFCTGLRASGCDARIASGGGRMFITMDRYEADWPMVERGWKTHVLGDGRAFASATEHLR